MKEKVEKLEKKIIKLNEEILNLRGGPRPDDVNVSLISRLNRTEGQIRGIKTMLEGGAKCDDILSQIAAVQGGMAAVAKILVKSHVQTCITPRLAGGDTDAVDELIKTIGRLL